MSRNAPGDQVFFQFIVWITSIMRGLLTLPCSSLRPSPGGAQALIALTTKSAFDLEE